MRILDSAPEMTMEFHQSQLVLPALSRIRPASQVAFSLIVYMKGMYDRAV